MGGGGTERRLVDILAHLDRARFAPHLYLMHRTGELLADVPADVPVAAYWGEPRRRPLGQRWLEVARCLGGAMSLDLLAVCRRWQPHLILDWMLPSAQIAMGPAWLRRIPRITSCVLDPASELALVAAHPRPWTHAWARLAYQSAARVLANSEDLRRRLIEFYRLDPQQVVTQYNLRDLGRLDALAGAGTPPRPATDLHLVTVGRLAPQKGHDILLHALKDVVHAHGWSAHLTILGQGPLDQELQRLAATLGLADRVAFLGYQANPYPYIQQADLFVLPSRYEGLPNALIEALALGTPVLAADCPTGPREVLEDGRLGELVAPGDPQALAMAIARCAGQREACRTRAQIAREAVRRRFDIAAGLESFQQLLLSVAQSGRKRD
jgi:glycosyltransferase involved in cell wall biosynthesis